MDAPVLYVVATPIGNLQDISLRALQLLRQATVIAAEDTRVARRLLAGLGIAANARLLSARAHNERKAADEIIRALQGGGCVLYLTDAGTPAVSDPGAGIVQAVRAAGIAVTPVPGASAVTALIAVAGLSEGALHFYGFPPAAAAARRRFFTALISLDGFSVFYEAPHRIAACLADLQAAFGSARRIVIGRELTKRHEQIIDGTLGDAVAAIASGALPARGEFTLAVENPAQRDTADGWRVFCHLLPSLPPRRAAAVAAKITGASAQALYKRHIGDDKH